MCFIAFINSSRNDDSELNRMQLLYFRMPEHERIKEQVMNAARKASQRLKDKYIDSKVKPYSKAVFECFGINWNLGIYKPL